MRTTIELDDERRARLLELAARRGEKGFSGIVAAALDAYFEALEGKASSRSAALTLRGVLSDEDAEGLRAETRAIRSDWR